MSAPQFSNGVFVQAHLERTEELWRNRALVCFIAVFPILKSWCSFATVITRVEWRAEGKHELEVFFSPSWLSHSIAGALISCSHLFVPKKCPFNFLFSFFKRFGVFCLLPLSLLISGCQDSFFFAFHAAVLWSLCLILISLLYMLLWAPFTTVCISASYQSHDLTDAASKITCAWCMKPKNKHLFQH